MSVVTGDWLAEPAQHLGRLVDLLTTSQTHRWAKDKLNLRLFYGPAGRLAADIDFTSVKSILQVSDARAGGGFNVVRACIGTVTAMVCRPPNVEITTDGASYTLRSNCKQATRIVNGIFRANDMPTLAYKATIDAETTSFGAAIVRIEDGAMKIRVVPPLSVLSDPQEGENPRTVHIVTAESKEALARKFPDHAEAIRRAPRWSGETVYGVEQPESPCGETVRFIETWRKREGKDPGRHLLVCGDAVLANEAYDEDFIPVEFLRWEDGYKSLAGKPMADSLVRYQYRLNEIEATLDRCTRAAKPRLITPAAAEVDGLSDLELEKIEYEGGVAPKIDVSSVTPQDLIARRTTLKAEAFEEVGANADVASGQLPPGVDSKVAMVELQEIRSQRLYQQAKRIEAWIGRLAVLVLKIGSKAWGKSASAREASPGTAEITKVDWQKLNWNENQYTAAVQGVSALGFTVSARLNLAQQLRDMEVLTAEQFADILQVPDIDAVLDAETAPLNLARKQIEAALYDGRWIAPHDIQNLQLLLTEASKQYQLAELEDDFPPANMELCRRLISECKRLIATQPANTNAAPAAAPPQAQAA